MAHPVHQALVGKDAEALRRWLEMYPQTTIDLSGTNLSGQSFERWDASNAIFAKSILKGAKLQHAILIGADFMGANLEGADLSDANLEGANFQNAVLQGARLHRTKIAGTNLVKAVCNNADFTDAKFDSADLTDAECYEATFNGASFRGTNLSAADIRSAAFQKVQLPGYDFSECKMSEVKFSSANLQGSRFTKADLSGASFAGANLTGAKFDNARLSEASLNGATLWQASFCKAILRYSDLSNANCREAEFQEADFFEAIVQKTNFTRTRGLVNARNLITVRVPEVLANDVREFDTIVISPLERFIGWEQIRWVGRLPLFAASYVALATIPLFYYMLDFYNRKVDFVISWARNEIQQDRSESLVAKFLLEHFHREPIPELSELLLVATILLGIGATIFAIFCPPRVREFSREQWCDELGRSAIHYAPLSWRYRNLRILCVACYAFGGAGVLCVIASKLWNVFLFIVANS